MFVKRRMVTKMRQHSKFNKNKFIVVIFIVIIYVPIFLWTINKVTNWKADVVLNGYTAQVKKPEFSIDAYLDGSFQEQYGAWIEKNMPLKGIYTKNYSTLQYNLFRLGNYPIAINKDVLQDEYLFEKYCIGYGYNYGVVENQNSMMEYVQSLQEVKNKLNFFGKKMFIYLAPSKADWDEQNIQQKYKDMYSDDKIRAYDYFMYLIAQTDIDYYDCSKMYSQLEYPAFYSTGIHWSRTYEQMASKIVLEKISDLCEKNYPEILLGEVIQSNKPYWRDADVFDNLNIWNSINETYYEYEIEKTQEGTYDQVRMLLYGDSFGQGLKKDILDRYPDSELFYVNYYNYVQTRDEDIILINQDWSKMNFGYYLDNADVVVIEMTKPCIAQYGCGFVDALNDFLDEYNPNTYMK